MYGFNNILFRIDSEVGYVTINRPAVLNALNYETMRELDELLECIAKDSSIKAVIITGSGDKAFAAGADIKEMQAMTAIKGREWGKFGQAVLSKIENLPQPVIAAVNGFALGGGCELAMACDIRLASNKAKFGQPEVTLGITPGFAGSQRLPRLVGRGIAKELLFTGDQIDAQTAFRIGLVNKVINCDELHNEATALAEKIVSRASIAIQLCKAAVNHGMDIDSNSAYAYEAEVFGLSFSTADQKEGMAAFVDRRKANFIDF